MSNPNSYFDLDSRFSTTRQLTQQPVREKPPTGLQQGGLRSQGYLKGHFPNEPLISIITVVFNGEKYLEKTILSVIEQSYHNVEYIIIDGGSTDGTLSILQQYNSVINDWLSEKDTGIYEAINKGVKLAQGEYLLFLGADDCLYQNNVIAEVISQIQGSTYALIFGKIIYDTGEIVCSALGLKTILHNTVHHQSCFYHRSLFEDWNYDTSLKLIADYELNLMAYLQRWNYFPLDTIIAQCRKDGLSQNRKLYNLCVNETNRVRSKHLDGFQNLIFQLVFIVKAQLYQVYKK